jgi:hypothetical protein
MFSEITLFEGVIFCRVWAYLLSIISLSYLRDNDIKLKRRTEQFHDHHYPETDL